MDKKRFVIFEGRCIRRMWYLTGVLKYDLDRVDLAKVMNKLKRIGCLPKGYCYPELIKSSEMPDELLQVIK